MRPGPRFGEVVILVAVDFDSPVRYDAKVAWTASQNGVEQLWIRLFGDLLDFGGVIDHSDSPDVIP